MKLTTDLKDNGFSLNYYEPCVANRLVNGDMMPMLWYIYYIKVSNKDPIGSKKVCTISVHQLLVQTQVTHGKGSELSGNGFGSPRTRGDESLNYQIFSEGPRRVSRKVERNFRHTSSRPSVPNKRGIGSRLLRGIQGRNVPPLVI